MRTASLLALTASQTRTHAAVCTCGCPPLTCATPEGLQLLMDSHASTPGEHFLRVVAK